MLPRGKLIARVASTTLVVMAGCDFTHGAAGSGGDDAKVDAPPLDTAPLTPRWISLGISTGSGASIKVVPFDGKTIGAACAATTTSAYEFREIVDHPTMPYVYGVETDFRGVQLGCNAFVTTTLTSLGAARPLQRIALNQSGTIGFFTMDGPLAVGVYRFAAQSDGTPSIAGSANGPSASGAVALVEADAQLFVAGAGQIFGYALTPTALDFPTMSTGAMICTNPVDLLASGSSLLAFCSDTPDVRRYTRSPFAFDTTVGALGAVSRVVALPGDRAIAARISPPQLASIALGAGTPTWTDGPTLPTAVTAMAASRDGSILVTGRSIDASTSELAVWSVTGTTVLQVDTETVTGTITSIAVTAPGT